MGEVHAAGVDKQQGRNLRLCEARHLCVRGRERTCNMMFGRSPTRLCGGCFPHNARGAENPELTRAHSTGGHGK